MRKSLFFIFVFSILVFSMMFLNASQRTNPFAASLAFADDEEEEILWPFGPYTGEDEEESGFEEPEEEPEEEEPNAEQKTEKKVVKRSEEEPVEEEEDVYLEEIPEINWDSVPGTKQPFFFLVDSSQVEGEIGEPQVARFKALKYGGAILNGIPFRYNVDTSAVYLTENVTSLPEFVHMIDEAYYVGVVRYDYEVAIPDEDYAKMRQGRSVVVAASVPKPSIATSFEETRREALIKGVQQYAQHMKRTVLEGKKDVGGVITAWDILNEGWLSDDESFYIEMRVWVKFDDESNE